jgi:hypothetical protein
MTINDLVQVASDNYADGYIAEYWDFANSAPDPKGISKRKPEEHAYRVP